jgi:hypothetical protein
LTTTPHDRNACRQAVRPSALAAGALALVPVLLVAWLSAVPATAGASVVAGTEEITQPGSLTPLDSGGSETLYGVVLPSGAGCPGDTAHHGYHIFSYLVPKDVSPAAVNFKRGRADKGFGYIAYGMYYGAINTALGTGLVAGLPPDFTWARLTPKDLFPQGQKSATWEGGIACANTDGAVTNYWNSQIVFTASTSDPRGFTWRVVAQPALGQSHKWVWIGVALIVLSVLLAALAVFLIRRRDQLSGGPSASDGKTPNPDGTPSPAGESDAAGHGAPEPSVAGR